MSTPPPDPTARPPPVPLHDPTGFASSPPPSPTHTPPPPPPGWPASPAGIPPYVTAESLLAAAAAAGRLQDAHDILAEYLSLQAPDPETGRLELCRFHESTRAAIANDCPAVLGYLFAMRVGEPALYIDDALVARSTAVFQVFLDHGWDINAPIGRAKAPALG